MFREEMRYDYPLNAGSLIWDVGGYKGDFTAGMIDKYDCYSSIYEPVVEFHSKISVRFATNPKVEVFNFGLSNVEALKDMSVMGDSSSTHRGTKSDVGVMRDVVSVMKTFKEPTNIDLIKINIEGDEYDLLERLLDQDMTPYINFIQVQFHPWIDDAYDRRRVIHNRLKKTHKVMWDYPFIWESWERK
jgi:FkbM family methyltransferase